MLMILMLSVSQTQDFSTVVEQSLSFTESGVKWRFDVMDAQVNDEHFVLLFRNGKRVAGYGMPEEGVEFTKGQFVYGQYFKVSEPVVKAPFKVVAIRGHSGMGHGQDTLFLGFRNGRVFQMGRGIGRGGENGGPVNWKGRRNEWLFDDYNWYDHYDLKKSDAPLYRYLYRIGKDGKLRFARRWIAPERKQLFDSVAAGIPKQYRAW